MTIEEAKANLASALELYERRMHFGHRGRTFTTDDLRTLLASHASLEERVKEAKRLMKPFARVYTNLLNVPDETRGHGGFTMLELRALAAFVNEKERT